MKRITHNRKKNKNVSCFMFHLSWKRGFTLIELLIAISVIIVFSGLSLAYYNQFTEEKKLETETQKLVDVLELARKKTSSNDISTYSCDNFSGYRVSIQNSSYQLILCCALDCDSNYSIQNYDLPINISIINGVGDIQFKPLTANINSATITLKSNSLSKCINILINTTGVIEIGNKYSC